MKCDAREYLEPSLAYKSDQQPHVAGGPRKFILFSKSVEIKDMNIDVYLERQQAEVMPQAEAIAPLRVCAQYTAA